MDNLDIIKNLFNLWIKKDYKKMKEILSNNIGYRDQFLTSNYGINKSMEYIKKRNLTSCDISNIFGNENTIYFNVICEFENNGQLSNENLHYKITFKNRLITKIFEELITNSKKRIKCVVAYDGSNFLGFQKQLKKNTIQSEIELAIFKVSHEKVSIHSSGRTDSGVHALNQVFHFDTTSKIDSEKWKIVLNSYLPKSILIKDSIRVPQSFHSRYDSISKEYMYIINTLEYTPTSRNYEWYKKDINIDILEKELKSIIGVNDFRSFAKVSENIDTLREILTVSVELADNKIKIYIKGTGFLRYMVRNIVGALVDISTGNSNLNMLEIMDMKNRDYAKNTAPAQGLYLKEVKYINE